MILLFNERASFQLPLLSERLPKSSCHPVTPALNWQANLFIWTICQIFKVLFIWHPWGDSPMRELWGPVSATLTAPYFTPVLSTRILLHTLGSTPQEPPLPTDFPSNSWSKNPFLHPNFYSTYLASPRAGCVVLVGSLKSRSKSPLVFYASSSLVLLKQFSIDQEDKEGRTVMKRSIQFQGHWVGPPLSNSTILAISQQTTHLSPRSHWTGIQSPEMCSQASRPDTNQPSPPCSISHLTLIQPP